MLQVEKWPTNPVDLIIARLAETCKTPDIQIADFGCGDAAVAQSPLIQCMVHSFDLVAKNSFVTAADMAHVPLPNACCSATVFCLSLMGTNYIEFIAEAHRVMLPQAVLHVAEVRSRVDGDLKGFERGVCSVGFRKRSCDVTNKMFVLYEFERADGLPVRNRARLHAPPLQVCQYKRR
eukprot:SAG31_NODE_3382_length_4335_cov_2.871813_1_plen_178_part_00